MDDEKSGDQIENKPEQEQQVRSLEQHEREPEHHERSQGQRRHSLEQQRRPPEQHMRPPEQYRRNNNQQRRPPELRGRSPVQYTRSTGQYRRPPEQYRYPPEQYRRSPGQYRRPPDQYGYPPDQHRRLPETNRSGKTLRTALIIVNIALVTILLVSLVFKPSITEIWQKIFPESTQKTPGALVNIADNSAAGGAAGSASGSAAGGATNSAMDEFSGSAAFGMPGNSLVNLTGGDAAAGGATASSDSLEDPAIGDKPTTGPVIGGAQELTIQFTAPIRVDEVEDTHYLELINNNYSISQYFANLMDNEPDAELIVSAWPTVAVSTTDIAIHTKTLEALAELMAAAREAGAGSFYISSGYRDYDKQSQIYDEMEDKSYAQPPNYSEHQTGLAADILAKGVLQANMATTKEGRWLAANSWKYGLIMRYDENKRDITGIAGEPWHYRYVGQPHAWFCFRNNICLEEYIGYLGETGGYSITYDGIVYNVSYQSPDNGKIYAPENMEYNISGDNTGNYIITAW